MNRFQARLAVWTFVAALPLGCESKEGRHRQLAKESLPRVEVVQPTLVESLQRKVELTVSGEPMARVDLALAFRGW